MVKKGIFSDIYELILGNKTLTFNFRRAKKANFGRNNSDYQSQLIKTFVNLTCCYWWETAIMGVCWESNNAWISICVLRALTIIKHIVSFLLLKIIFFSVYIKLYSCLQAVPSDNIIYSQRHQFMNIHWMTPILLFIVYWQFENNSRFTFH